MPDLFFESREFYRTEIAILEEKVYYTDTSPKKFSIPILTPLAREMNTTISASNILNKKDIDKLKIGKINMTTTVLISVPAHIMIYLPKDNSGYIHPGINFIITFVGGDITKPRVIGVY